MGRTAVEFRGGMHFVGLPKSGHEVHMDAGVASGGQASAPTPVEAMLCSLAGCTGMDIVSILRKMKTVPDHFRVLVDDARAEEYPKVFTKLHLTYEITGDIPEANVKKAIELSLAKYCPIANTLSGVSDITYTFSIQPTSLS